jgi:hypothetical protein
VAVLHQQTPVVTQVTVGGDKAYDTADFVAECRTLKVTPHAQMIGALKQLEAGRKVDDVVREVGVSKHDPCLEREVRRNGCVTLGSGWLWGHELRELKSDASVGYDRGRARPAHGDQRDNGPELTSRIFWRGVWSGESSWCTFKGGSRRRTRTSRVSTGACEKKCLRANWFQVAETFSVADRVQRCQTAQQFGISDAEGVC